MSTTAVLVHTTTTGDAPGVLPCEADPSLCIWWDLTGAWVECSECGRLDQWFD